MELKKRGLIITPDDIRNEKFIKLFLKANYLIQTPYSLYYMLMSNLTKKLSYEESIYLKEKLRGLSTIPIFYERRTRIFRYLYGNCYKNIGNNKVIFGTDQMPKVSFLYNAIRVLIRFCTPDFEHIIYRLFVDPNKHWDNLCELDPLVRLTYKSNVKSVKYEAKIAKDSNKSIDWLIELTKNKYAIEVKSRQKPLINSLLLMSEANAEGIFRDCESKFNEDANLIKVIWIITAVRFQNESLLDEFKKLNRNKLNAAVITNLVCPARVLSHSASKRESKDRMGTVLGFLTSSILT